MTFDLNDRENFILGEMAEKGSISVTALARRLEVSEVTIRSDLKGLEEKGFVNRTRGGASPAFQKNIVDRQRLRQEEKNRIAKAAADLVKDGDSIMIEAGTTTALIVRHLAGRRGVQIVTNSTLVFSYSRLNPALTIILTGGVFRKESESLVGPVAVRAIRDFNVRLAFIGTDGFSLERGLTTQFVEGAEVIKAMKERTRETWLVADSSKYGRSGFVSFMTLSEVDGIISDTGFERTAADSIRELPVELRLV